MAARTAAFFDVDRTLVGPQSMERLFIPFLIQRRYLTAGDLARYLAFLARRLGEAGALHENKYHFKDKDPAELERLAAECFRTRIKPRLSPTGRRMVQKHLEAGHLVVLVTGSLAPLAEQIRREVGAHLALAACLGVKGGTLSGTLSGPRPYGAVKAQLVRELARRHHLDLAKSYAYGDHHSDAELLSLVGNPRVVNPNPALRLVAYRKGWPILKF